jgi:hypothetical protein
VITLSGFHFSYKVIENVRLSAIYTTPVILNQWWRKTALHCRFRTLCKSFGEIGSKCRASEILNSHSPSMLKVLLIFISTSVKVKDKKTRDRGQFHQPYGAKRNYAGGHSLATFELFSFHQQKYP